MPSMPYRYQVFVFFFILLINGCSTPYTLSCVYSPIATKDNPYPELTQYSHCGKLDDSGALDISDKHFKNIWFNEDKLAEIRILDGIYYISSDGKLAKTHLFDNGADYFQEGLARTIKNGKFGFINKQLQTIIAPEYDFAFPFSQGRAKVCIGCQAKKVGEHSTVVNGLWGYIGTTGEIIVDISHKQDEIDSL